MGHVDMDIYVVDVCGTLVRDDTTLGLLRHHFARDGARRFRYILFKLMTSRYSLIRLFYTIVERLTGRHFLKFSIVKMLAGDSVATLSQSAKQYSTTLLKERRVAPVWSLIEHAAKSGRVLLASASLEPIVACLATEIGARYVASQLESQDGILTGYYTKDLTWKKEEAIQDKYGPSFLTGHFCVISDNFSDRDLLARADLAFVVLHSESHRKCWQWLNAKFLWVEE
jgi:phosphoserine phosphatase